jgi:hypothetical protein
VGEFEGGIGSPEILADYLNQSPEDEDYALIGRIALQHTGLEYQIETIIWYYMGDVDKGHIATATLGAVARTDMLEAFVEWTEPDDGIAEAIIWTIKQFHILRENRNSIIHAYNFRADRKAQRLILERRTKSLVMDRFQVFEINREVLEKVVGDQNTLALYVYMIFNIMRMRPSYAIGPNLPPPREPAVLPAKPSPPEPLSPLPHESAKSARRLRLELAEKEARESKVRRKEEQRAEARRRRRELPRE